MVCQRDLNTVSGVCQRYFQVLLSTSRYLQVLYVLLSTSMYFQVPLSTSKYFCWIRMEYSRMQIYARGAYTQCQGFPGWYFYVLLGTSKYFHWIRMECSRMQIYASPVAAVPELQSGLHTVPGLPGWCFALPRVLVYHALPRSLSVPRHTSNNHNRTVLPQ